MTSSASAGQLVGGGYGLDAVAVDVQAGVAQLAALVVQRGDAQGVADQEGAHAGDSEKVRFFALHQVCRAPGEIPEADQRGQNWPY